MKKSAIVTALALSVSAWSLTAQVPGAQPVGQSPPPQAGALGDPRGFHIFPPRSQEKLNLSDDQKRQVSALETDVQYKLGAILTAEQFQQLGRMHPPHHPGAAPAGQGGSGIQPDGQTGGKSGADWGAVTPGHPDPVAPVAGTFPAPTITGFHLIAHAAQERLALSADQQKQVVALETEVKGKLDTILTPDQELQLEQLRNSRRPSEFTAHGTDTASADPAAPAPTPGSTPKRP